MAIVVFTRFMAILWVVKFPREGYKIRWTRGFHMGELRNNTTSSGTITKKRFLLENLRLLVQKIFFYVVIFFVC